MYFDACSTCLTYWNADKCCLSSVSVVRAQATVASTIQSSCWLNTRSLSVATNLCQQVLVAFKLSFRPCSMWILEFWLLVRLPAQPLRHEYNLRYGTTPANLLYRHWNFTCVTSNASYRLHATRKRESVPNRLYRHTSNLYDDGWEDPIVWEECGSAIHLQLIQIIYTQCHEPLNGIQHTHQQLIPRFVSESQFWCLYAKGPPFHADLAFHIYGGYTCILGGDGVLEKQWITQSWSNEENWSLTVHIR